MKTTAAAMLLALIWMSSLDAHSQTKKRLAVFEFDDRGTADNGANHDIGMRVADGLISQLAGSGDFDVVDRDNLDRIMHEQNLGQGQRYDAQTAARIGKLANVNLLVLGRVESATESVKQKGMFRAAQVADINITATARVIQVDTGNILKAPTDSCDIKDGDIGNGVTNPRSTPQAPRPLLVNDDGLLHKVSDCIIDLSQKLAKDIREASLTTPSVPSMNVVIPKFIGIEDGLVLINKGRNVGIKVGDRFDVSRKTDTGLKDPDTGNAVYHKKSVCMFTVTEVEDDNASGKCEGVGTPQKDDIFSPAAKQ
jgi:hypothetical protein